ncbi:hypothetical protein QR680_001148 [Steinernema hermaphroditum]|uniref:glutathione transferase n=1 Tax=Steinernema hermaphroditum TaxID=289476 RepID=A0AA39LEW4_9BILA|nr:hypothetical protein QR680_001148 [Steinernema hermaphroditum]
MNSYLSFYEAFRSASRLVTLIMYRLEMRKCKKATEYKLIYFDIRNLAETARLMFECSGTKYEDVRISASEWSELKKSTPFGMLPVLEVNGKPVYESQAINRYLAGILGFGGRNNFENAQLDAVADSFKDFRSAVRPFIYVAGGMNEGDTEELRKTALLPAVESYFPKFCERLKASSSSFLFDFGVSWVDFDIADCLYTLVGFDQHLLDNYPELGRLVTAVREIPSLKSYYERRPVRPF